MKYATRLFALFEGLRGVMTNSVTRTLKGIHVLVVEDEPLVAMALEDELIAAGAIVVGPVGTLDGALQLIAGHTVEAAVLDIQLHGKLVFPAADLLAAQSVPFIFTSGFGSDAIPAAYADVPCCEKPASAEAVVMALAPRL